MKKKGILVVLLVVCLALSLVACNDSTEKSAGGSDQGQKQGDIPKAKSGGVTLAEMRKAAEKSGYAVTDNYVALFMKDVKTGFTVQIVADGSDTVYSVLECGTEEAAIANAKEIDDAGYNIALRSGRFLTFYDVDAKDGEAKDILTSILAGKAMEKK